VVRRREPGQALSQNRPGCHLSGGTTRFSLLFRRNLLEIADHRRRPVQFSAGRQGVLSEQAMAHDQWIWYLGATFGSVALKAQELTLYRQHAANAVGFSAGGPKLSERARQDKASDFRQGAEGTERCAALMQALAASLCSSMRTRASSAVTAMRYRARVLRLRSKLYEDGSAMSGRMTALRALLAERAYGPELYNRYSVPRIALLKDLVFGVMAVSRVLRH